MAMVALPLPDESYALESLPASAKKLINLYVEQLPSDARSPTILRNTPGLLSYITVGSGPVIEIDTTLTTTVYVLSGTHFYRLTSPGTVAATDLGSVGTTSGYKPTIAVGTQSACVCVPPNAFVCDHTGALSQITDPNYTATGANSVAYLDGRFVFTSAAGDDQNQFFCSDLLSGTSFTALNFAYANGDPNFVTRVIQHQGNLWFFGSSGIEAWYDAGLANFPYQKQPGSDITYGCFRTETISICDNALFYLGMGGIVYRLDGYTPTRVSTNAVEEWIRDFADDVNVDACSYTHGGHTYYVLNFTGSVPRTLAYDTLTQKWHDRNSVLPTAGVWLGQAAANFNSANAVGLPQGAPLIGDRNSGNIYVPSQTSNADNSVLQQHVMTLPAIYAKTKRAFMSRLELEIETGIAMTNANIMLEISDDGGKTYRSAAPQVTGTPGNTRYRVVWTRLGSFRIRVLRFTFYDLVSIYSAYADITEGTW